MEHGAGVEGQYMWEETPEPEVTLPSIAEGPRRRKGTRASRAHHHQETHPRGMSLEDLPQERWKEVDVPAKGVNYRTTVEVIGIPFQALLDTGANANAASEKLVLHLLKAWIPSVRSALCSSRSGEKGTM